MTPFWDSLPLRLGSRLIESKKQCEDCAALLTITHARRSKLDGRSYPSLWICMRRETWLTPVLWCLDFEIPNVLCDLQAGSGAPNQEQAVQRRKLPANTLLNRALEPVLV